MYTKKQNKIVQNGVDKTKMSAIIDQTRPDQTRPDQTRPDQTRPELWPFTVKDMDEF